MDAAAVAAVVLAAGAASRFGAAKLLAPLAGRTLLERVLDVVASAGFAETVVVLGAGADAIEGSTGWRDQRRVRNPDPGAGLSGSLRIGLDAVGEGCEAAMILLGDQPLVRGDVIAALLQAAVPGGPPIVVPRYAGGGGANPVLVRRAAFGLASEASGDRGLGPILARRPDLVAEVPVEGDNPDVDTPADLAAVAWGLRVRENREQVERFREAPDPPDFYAPQVARFRDDPRRVNDPVLDLLRTFVLPDDVWLDIGAGAGRYALPIALLAREVIALDSSPGMLAALGEGMAEHGIRNVRILEGRWPAVVGDLAGDKRRAPAAGDASADGTAPDAERTRPGIPEALRADVALIASVGYDIEDIGPFLDAMEAAARRLCVAVLTERQPASAAEPFWPPIHGVARVPLPGLPEFVDLLRARGRAVEIDTFERGARTWPDVDAVASFLRQQLWLEPGSDRDRLLSGLLRERIEEREGGVWLRELEPMRVGVARWRP